MRALVLHQLTGPSGLRLDDVDEPGEQDLLLPGKPVIIDVRAAGVSFPDLLRTHGRYQSDDHPPFVPGAEVAGCVRCAPVGSGFTPGQRVAALTVLGGFAEVAVAPDRLTFALPDRMSFAEGAALVMNYHTAYFCLHTRGRLVAGERVLVHGAAGGVGTAAVQVARGLGATTIAAVSTDAKARVAWGAGADEVVLTDGGWLDRVRAVGGADLVYDPVGGEQTFIDSLRALREGGRLVVVGFASGIIPRPRVNRLLLNNIEIIGASWGTWALPRPEFCRQVGDALDQMIETGIVSPIVGARFSLSEGAAALELLARRGAVGKTVLEL